jgi:hypothetical protein
VTSATNSSSRHVFQRDNNYYDEDDMGYGAYQTDVPFARDEYAYDQLDGAALEDIEDHEDWYSEDCQDSIGRKRTLPIYLARCKIPLNAIQRIHSLNFWITVAKGSKEP